LNDFRRIVMKNRYQGRSLAVIDDLSREERMYLFMKSRELKEALKEEALEVVDRFRINNPDFGIYEVFLEDSTRTRESFRNAAQFHGVKLGTLHAASSSFNKKESYADTFDNLCGYDNMIFIVRSKLEGVCRWLEKSGREYARRMGLEIPPAFINAGDGKHEHPTQELLDELTILEDNKWDTSTLHLALVGDLYHGRTVHSKADGLTIFDKVTIDLVAPPELAMPDAYIKKMKAHGYKVRIFSSIDDYIKAGDVAGKWYFTRPQLERMGEKIRARQDELRGAITAREDQLPQLSDGTVFYHPLPRNKQYPTIPTFLDNTPFNGWERQSANGRIVRIILLGLIAGTIGADFTGKVVRKDNNIEEDFIHEVEITGIRSGKRYSEGVQPINEGYVIDHICKGDTPREIRDHMTVVNRVLKLTGRGGEWVSRSGDGYKGIIFRPGDLVLDDKMIKKLAAVAPGCTLNHIKKGQVERKLRLTTPPRIYGFKEISCKNPDCISHPEHSEGVPADFERMGDDTFRCVYCETSHTFKKVWG
jgi:aspartate carbamoyltransferase